jgi:hypothetical protein
MTITFATDLPRPQGTEESPCLCAQMTTGFASMMRGHDGVEVRANLAAGAAPACPSCHGSGVESVPQEDPLSLNLANDNGFRLLALLGLPVTPTGECTIAEARRALLRARNGRVDCYAREDEVVHGALSGRGDGAVELRPVRAWIRGLSVERLAGYVNRLDALVRRGGVAGATRIVWY